MKKVLFFVEVCLFVLCSVAFAADIPRLINYQGMLTDDGGDPLNGTPDIMFRIYNASSGGTLRWNETHSSIPVTDGLFNVILGSQSGGINLDFSEDYWLEIQVDNDTMPERLQFTSVGYAYRARIADSATVAVSTPTGGGWVDDGSRVRLQTSSDNVGIGTSSPGDKLDVNGDLRVRGADIRDAGGTTRIALTDNGRLDLMEDGGTTTLSISTDAKVGIGTTTPDEKLHVVGDIRLNSGGNIAFADDNTRVYESVDDLYLTADDDIHLRPDDDIYIRYDGASSDFVRLDPGAKEVGIGTTEPTEMLHVENWASGGRAFIKLETSHATNYDEVGIRFQTPENMWHFRMDDDTHLNLPDTGSVALRSQNSGIEVMTWTDDGHVGIGTTEPSEELDVDGTILGAMPLTAVGIATDGTYYATILVAAVPSSGKVYVRAPSTGILIGALDQAGNYGLWVDFGTPDASSRIVGVGVSLEYSGSAGRYASVISVRMSSGTVYLRIPNSNTEIGDLDNPGYYGSWENFWNPGL
jgi:hypothetical protein